MSLSLNSTYVGRPWLHCPDPGVLRDGNTYYMVCTSGTYGYPIRSSPDLVHWTSQGTVFTSASHPTWASGDYWAPEMHAVNGGYVVYFSARASASAGARKYATSTTRQM